MAPKQKASEFSSKSKKSSHSGNVATKSRSANNRSASSSSYLNDDTNYAPFEAQLSRIGLSLRDVVGDGNCCFRALSDQLFGNESQHNDIRQRTCQYMRQNRDEFQPFMAALLDDDDMSEKSGGKKASSKQADSYDRYVKTLETLGIEIL